MNIAKIKLVDVANGPGVRVSIFVSGCRNHCKNCFNPEAWDFSYGSKYRSEKFLPELSLFLEPNTIAGLSILGGEPLDRLNVKDVREIVSYTRCKFPNKTIWLYSGYTYENLIQRAEDDNELLDILHFIDVLVDGPFVEEQKDLKLHFRGSRNQRIIDVHRTLKKGEVVLWQSEK